IDDAGNPRGSGYVTKRPAMKQCGPLGSHPQKPGFSKRNEANWILRSCGVISTNRPAAFAPLRDGIGGGNPQVAGLIARNGENGVARDPVLGSVRDRKSTRLNSSHRCISYAVFCLKKKGRHEGAGAT